VRDEILKHLKRVVPKNTEINLTVPENDKFGHYSTNVAFSLSKKNKKDSGLIAEEIARNIEKTGFFSRVEAVNGFVNFWLKDEVFHEELVSILKNREKYGCNNSLKNQKTIVEYTDPNPFKEFHIGHLMSNSIGETISRLIEWSGAKVKRACYQGDVGLHVAKAIWGMRSPKNKEQRPVKGAIKERIRYMANAYILGSEFYEKGEARGEMQEINKLVYERSDEEINELYDWGRKASLEYFETIYKKLGTKFDYYFFESESGKDGMKAVEAGLEKGVFEESDGAVIFRGEKRGLHTRVFVNSEGLPTYEAKDLGLAEIKYRKYNYDKSVIITGNEVKDYFRVVLMAMSEVLPELARKTTHLSHGMMRLSSGKMSSRTGKVVTFESIAGKVEELVAGKIKDESLSAKEKDEIKEKVAMAALKYSILKQAVGSDIVFDFEKSISFEGDSGPYLQYALVRARSVLEKAKSEKIKPSFKLVPPEVSGLEPKICYFPEIVEWAARDYAPNYLVLYLTELARVYNNYYAKVKIVDSEDKYSPYKVVLTSAFEQVMKNGLEILGISAPKKM
jgi:arginyl-tRNA synthetase